MQTVQFGARGTSMLPSIYPGDRLHVRETRAPDLIPGTVVAFPGSARVTCHRIVGTEDRADGRWLLVRGDAQTHAEWVREDAVAWTLVEVDGRLGRWYADGARGRVLAWLALGSDPIRSRVRHLAVGAILGLAALRRR